MREGEKREREEERKESSSCLASSKFRPATLPLGDGRALFAIHQQQRRTGRDCLRLVKAGGAKKERSFTSS